MILFSFLFGFSVCWTPAFHQAFAAVYANKYLPNITEAQRTSFLLGSMYADGVDKRISHFVRPVIRELNSITNRKGNLYWFFLGVLNHITIDTFAHSGLDKTLVVPYGVMHHAAELCICSWAQRNLNASYIHMSTELINQIAGIGINFKPSFKYMYPGCYFVSKLVPLQYTMPYVFKKQNNMSRLSYNQAQLLFLTHFEHMLLASKELMSHAHDSTLNEIDVRDIVQAELDRIPTVNELFNNTDSKATEWKVKKLKQFILSPVPFNSTNVI